MLVCGDQEDADDCCPDEAPPDNAPADDCCPDDPADKDEPSGNSEGSGNSGEGDDCLCCTTDFELALLDQDDVVPAASYPVIFDALVSIDWQGAIWKADVLPVPTGTQRGVGPPAPPDTLLKQRTMLQI